ncbi:WD repeat-containing protein 26 [Smittium culicis]|uniref:WD repeat-containing protein 26 n=1 Tax=Smittium culicis TaxID=133412 RepID=A0A1R1YAL8_9FUNG|nr:WD repeat-containing protein 26 [Smittium culicis]
MNGEVAANSHLGPSENSITQNTELLTNSIKEPGSSILNNIHSQKNFHSPSSNSNISALSLDLQATTDQLHSRKRQKLSHLNLSENTAIMKASPLDSIKVAGEPQLSSTDPRVVIRKPIFKEQETVRLILQQLWDLGFRDSFHKLQDESGYLMEESIVYDFKKSILNGSWKNSIDILNEISTSSKVNKQTILFKIKRQQYLEALDSKNIKSALTILQSELSALSSDPAELLLLTRLIMCSSQNQFRKMASWFGNVEKTRQDLIDSLHGNSQTT